MFKKSFFIFIFFISITFSSFASNNINIIAKVNGKIITNFDIDKEGDYLKALNPNLLSLDGKKIFDLSKNSLINEIIKKAELSKYVNLKDDNEENDIMINQYLKDLYIKLNLVDEKDLEKLLISKNTYSVKEVKEKLKVEILWNQLIYARYGNLVKIDKDKMLKKVEKLKNEKYKEYFLKEIVFKKKKDQNLNTLIKEIKDSISEIGFDNTANIYSISESAKYGGKIGWISENQLTGAVSKELKKINKFEITNIIPLANNKLILKIEDIREKSTTLNKEKELQKMIKYETNKQLNQYSRIYFDKTKVNFLIDEN